MTVTPSYQILVGTVAFMLLPVLVASMGGPIGDLGRMTVVHIPLAMALMGLAAGCRSGPGRCAADPQTRRPSVHPRTGARTLGG